MALSFSRKSSLWLEASLVMLMAVLVTMILFGRSHWHDWSLPHWIEGDPLEIYARVQIATEQPGHALAPLSTINRLGAPFAADWSGYPMPDRLVFSLTGALARHLGIIAAVNLASAAIFVLNSLSFFLCARWLRWRWEWAAALALTFTFCCYNLQWGITLSLDQTFTLPPLVLLCARAARRGAAPDRTLRWSLLAGVLGCWLGLGNPYLAYFSGLIAGGTFGLALLRRVPFPRLAPLGLFLASLSLFFFAANATFAWEHLTGHHAEVFARGAGDYAVYAFRPLDWFVPPGGHRINLFSEAGHAYIAARHGAGEFFYNYLGVVGLAGLLGLLFTGVRRLLRNQLHGLDAQLGLLWIGAVGVAGGLNSLLYLAGVDMFRASTRISIYAVIWSLLYLGGRLSRLTRRLPALPSSALAAALVVVACWDQAPGLADWGPRERSMNRWAAVRQSATLLEAALPPGAAVFQLPAVPFPESGRTVAMSDYEHFLPFLATKTLRFSYGNLRTAPAARWVRFAASQPAATMIATLEQAGFSALWIDRRGFADQATGLLDQLHGLRLVEIDLPQTQPVRCFRLHPAAHPILPDLTDPRLQDPWDDHPAGIGQPSLYAVEGWYNFEQDNGNRWRWAQQQAVSSIWWNGPAAPATLLFTPGGQTGCQLELTVNGRRLWSGAIVTGQPQLQRLSLTLPPGQTLLEWRMEGPTIYPTDHDPRRLGFRIDNLSVSVP
ncbi:MAG: hypothetical protein ACHQ5A_07655 [Opitutales bacterium]